MPNHITNIITASPAVIDAITRVHTDEEKAEIRRKNAETAARYKERTGNDWPYAESDAADIDKRFVDFNMIIPMPEAIANSTVGSDGEAMFSQNGWYGWSVANWGTKWNGYDASTTPLEGDLCELRFDTAWSHPEPVVYELSLRFPDEVLKVEYADEDLGSNVGSYTMINGVITDLYQPDYREDEEAALGMAVRIKYGQTYEEYKAERLADDLDSARRYAHRKRIEAQTGELPGYDELGDVPDDIVQAITTEEQADSVWADDSELLNQLVTKEV